jgi:hypothetical protein
VKQQQPSTPQNQTREIWTVVAALREIKPRLLGETRAWRFAATGVFYDYLIDQFFEG